MKRCVQIFFITFLSVLFFVSFVNAQENNAEAEMTTSAVSEESEKEIIEEKTDYDTVLSFPLTEEKLKNFVILADKIDQVNNKWDYLIASAETDTLAVEYNGSAAEEMVGVLKDAPLSLDEYNEIFEYSIKNADFKNIISAYKLYYVTDKVHEKENVSDTEIDSDDQASSAISAN